jgi:hypothetical protein
MCRKKRKGKMKAKRIKIAKGQEVELYLSRTETPATCCDGKRTGLRATMTLKGPGTICMVTKKTRTGSEE